MLKTKDGLDLFTQSWKVPNPKALVVLHHGFDDHCGRFGRLVNALNEASYPVYAFDCRGHGRSGGPRGYTPNYGCLLNDYGFVIADAKNSQPSKKVFLYGHSMGGNIALNYALRRPQGLSGVIVASPQLRLAFEPPVWKVLLARIMSNIWPRFSLKTNLDASTLSHDPQVVHNYQTDGLLHGIQSARLFCSIAKAADYAFAHAGDLALPILLMHGSADRLTDPKATQQFFKSVTFADKTLKLYDGQYHELHNETALVVMLTDLVEWLNGHV